MEYVILMRKINVGTENRISKNEMEKLFIDLGYDEVEIYINSGNAILKTKKSMSKVCEEVSKALNDRFNEEVQFIIKTRKQMEDIANLIPEEWQNNDKQKTDIAYLFNDIDDEKIIDDLTFKNEYVNLKYIKGALIMNVLRENQGKSQLTKLISSKIYKRMTIRNVNTARYLGNVNN
jgi:uncharacterized protein (DUF1697 family)